MFSPSRPLDTETRIEMCEDLAFVAANEGTWFHSEDGVTVLMVPEFKDSNTMRVSVSVRAWREPVDRPEVGLFHALDRMAMGEFIKVNTPWDMHAWAAKFAALAA